MKLFPVAVVLAVLLGVGAAGPVRTEENSWPTGRAAGAVFQPEDLKIVSSVWGAGEIFIDVTGRVNEVVSAPGGESAVNVETLRYDPFVGQTKELVTVFEYHGERYILNVQEGDRIGVAELRECVRNRTRRPPAGPPLAGEPTPRTAEESVAFMGGTTWDLGLEGETPDNAVTFYRNGTFKFLDDGTVGDWVVEGPATMRFFDKDPVTLNRDRTRFRAVGDWKAYVGVLRQ